jgi:trans-aconitate methyltransferase
MQAILGRLDRVVAVEQDDWEQHWEQFAESAARNPAQIYRRRLVFDCVRDQPARILDIGSGQGDLAADCVVRFPEAHVVGIEVSSSGIRAAQSKVKEAVFLQLDLSQRCAAPPAYERWASHAFCSEVLEHVDDPVSLLRHSRCFLQPGCVLVVTVPGGPMSAFDRHIGHRKHFRRDDLRFVLEEAGFVVDSVRAAGFPFFNLYRLLVLLRGKKLVADAATGGQMDGSLLARSAMATFRALFHLNLSSSPWGWQLVASARVGDEASVTT